MDLLKARRLTGVMLLAAGLGACQPSAKGGLPEHETFLDPVTEAPEYYTLEFENPYVRVVRERVPAGTKAPMHSHDERVSVFLNDAEVTLLPLGGDPVLTKPAAGAIRWDEASTHGAIVAADVENLSIELKELDGDLVGPPALDAVAVDPAHHTVDFENERVRVVRMIYPAGTKTPRHSHRRGFGVFLTDAHGRNIMEDGDVVPIDAEARSTFWTEGGGPGHVTENMGDDALIVLLVEMKREPGAPPSNPR